MPRNQFGFGWEPQKRGKNPFFEGGFGTTTLKIPKISLFDYNKSGKKVRVPVSTKIQRRICLRSKGKCEMCKKSVEDITPHIHHKDKNPKNNKESNLMLICPNCHSKKHRNDKHKRKKDKGQYGINSLTGRKEKVQPLF